MKRRFASTRFRLALIAAGVLLVAVVLADLGLIGAVRYTSSRDADAALARQAGKVAAGLTLTGGEARFDGGALPDQATGGTAIDIAVVGPGGVVGQTSNQPFKSTTLVELAAPALRRATPFWAEIKDSAGINRRVYVFPVGSGGGHELALVASRPTADVESDVSRAMGVLALLSLIVVVIGAALAHWLAGRVLRPVGRIAQVAETLSEKDLHRRLTIATPKDELGELVETFNRMLDRLDTSFSALRTFTADASHELRAPLALMKSDVELALSRPRREEDYRATLRALKDEIEGMTSTVERLLFLARSDAGSVGAELRMVDLVDLLHEEVSRWTQAAAAREVSVSVDCPDTASGPVDPFLLRRILDNLLENAIRHAPAGSAVVVTLDSNGQGPAIRVTDNGPGIPPSLRPRLFTRFFRADGARRRGRQHGGAGLGLAVSRAMALAMGADLTYVPCPSGATFRLQLRESLPVSDRSGPAR